MEHELISIDSCCQRNEVKDVKILRNTDYPDKLIKRDFTLPDRSGTGRGPGGGMLRSTLAR